MWDPRPNLPLPDDRDCIIVLFMKYKMYKINPANLDQHVQLLSLYAQFLTFIFSEKYDGCNFAVILYEVKIIWWQRTI